MSPHNTQQDIYWNLTQNNPIELQSDTSHIELQSLYNTQQEPYAHAEGNVGIHTQLVLEQIEKQIYKHSNLDPIIARASALFHDIGKPQTTKTTQQGRIAAPGHDVKGAELANLTMAENPHLVKLSREQKAAIKTLIREHMWGYNIENVSKGAMLRLTQLVHPQHLWSLWQADVKGRECANKTELLERLDYAQEYMIEHGAGIFRPQPYLYEACELGGWDPDNIHLSVKRELLRGVITGTITNISQAYAYISERSIRRKGKIIYMVGLPGVGKSTLGKQMAQENGWTHLTYDTPRKRDRRMLAANNWNAIKTGLTNQETLIVDATHLERKSRDPLIAIATQYRSKLVAVSYDIDTQLSIQAQTARQASVPTTVIKNMAAKYRHPTCDEYDMLLYGEDLSKKPHMILEY